MNKRPLHLLFICTANVCRSPLAAGLMALNAKEVGAQVRVASASLDREIRKTHPTTTRLLGERGVELVRQDSQPLTESLINGADLVLVMTSEHARALVGRFPLSRKKVFLLKHLAAGVQSAANQELNDWLTNVYGIRRDYAHGDQWDIQDPITESDSVYESIGQEIDNATMWLATVVSGVTGNHT